ncbi:MAG: hypothetical protein ACAI44_09075 [Candidatus Sericytochromatia bacterium]
MNRTLSPERIGFGLNLLTDILAQWPGFPMPTESVLQAWAQAAEKRQQLMIPLGESSQGQWLKVQARALEDLARLIQARPAGEYYSVPPPLCPACERKLEDWDCPVCGYRVVNLERFIKETMASMHPVQHLPFDVLLLPDPMRKRLLFLDLSQPGHVLWEVPLEDSCRYPVYAQYLPEKRLIVADSKGCQVLICDLLGHVSLRLDSQALGLKEPVMATCFLAAEGERRFLIVDRAGQQVLIVGENGRICQRFNQELSQPTFAALNSDQNLLICDTGHGRVLELSMPQGRLLGCFSQGLSAPVWAQKLEDNKLMVADQHQGRIFYFQPAGLQTGSNSLHVMSTFRPHQLYLRRNGQLVISQAGQAWEIRPGLPHLSGFWELENLICAELPVLVARPVLRPRRQAAPAKVPHNLGEALRQTELFGQARPEVLEMARRLCRCIRLKAGQILNLDEQAGLIYVCKGQIAFMAEETRLYSAGSLLGDAARPTQNRLAGQELRALVPSKLYLLTRFSLETLLPYLAKADPAAPALPKPSRGLGNRVKQLLSRPPRNQASHQGIKLNLYYTPAEREILLSAEDYKYRSYEIHLQFMPQGQQLEQLVKLFQLIKSQGYLVKHRWFDGSRLLVAHVILNGVDTAPLKRLLTQLDQLDKFWIEPVVFNAPDTPSKKFGLLHSAGA